MSNLVNHLRMIARRDLIERSTLNKAADRIEQLEKMMAAQGKVAIKLAEYVDELEAALREIAALGFWDGDRAMNIARKALGEGSASKEHI